MSPLDQQDKFWSVYVVELAAHVARSPNDFALKADETPELYANRTVANLRRAVERGGKDGSFGGFIRINYRASKAAPKAARAVGVPFTRVGLDSLYPQAPE